ncbi:MAG: hypothetical protein KGO05_09495 [Chloroflexota bacterium]|nr:hypothetical protein [Chloroflexota bacterium]
MAEHVCLRCGAPYDEGATVCFTCGASIGELETPTQPVRAPQRPAPAAPVEQPAAEQPAMPATAVVASPGPSPASRPLTVGGASYRASVAPAPRPIRWSLVIVALVVIAALATGGVLTARALLAGKPIPATTIYHDPQRRFSFAEPSLWTVTGNPQGALLTDSSGANTITISVASATSGQAAGLIADGMARQQGLQSAPDVGIGGDQWQQRTGSVTGQDGATRIVTLYVDVRAGALYTIETSSPTSVADSMTSLVYQPLLASFIFK